MKLKSLFLVALLLPAAALAAKPKVVLDAAKPVGPLIEKALKAKYQIVKQSVPDSPTGGDVKNACRDAGGAIAVVTARPGGDLWTVMVLNGADGSPLSTFRVKAGKKPPKALAKPDVKKLLDGLGDAKAPKKDEAAKPPPEEKKPEPVAEKQPEEKKPEPVAEKQPEEKKGRTSEPPPPPREEVRTREDPPSRASDDKKPTALRLGVGFKIFNRTFGYRDDIFDALSTYYLPRGPAIGAELELYPAAFITSGFAANIGVMGQFDYAVGIASRAEDGTRYGTTALNLRGALTVRIPVSILTIQPHFGFSRQVFSISSSSGVKPNIPTVGYNALRPGIIGKVRIFGPVAFQVGFAYLALLNTGEIGSYFPRSKAQGLDADAALTVGLFDRLELKLGGAYQRYWFSMNPEPGDPNVAGGALDYYWSGNLTVSFTL